MVTLYRPKICITMAIVENFWLKDQRKKLAGAVIYQAMGQTRSRKLAETVSNPRTTSQMNQRVRWANLVNLYRANQSWLKYAFETKKQNQSEYNKWMSLNVTNSRIYLTKQLAAIGACVVDSYIVTQGSLPSIESVRITDGWSTNIILNDSTILDVNTTVAQLSANLLANNPAIREGDQLSFIRLTQLTNADNGAPYVVVRKYEMLINSSSSALVKDFLPLDYIDSTEAAVDCRLLVKDSGNAGGFAMVLSRTIGGRTYVSSQSIVVANNSELINYYSSNTALQAAIDSYGENAEAFLSSSFANRADSAPVLNSILSVSVDNQDKIPGTFFQLTKALASKSLTVHFSSIIEGMVDEVSLTYLTDGNTTDIALSNPSISGKDISGALPAASGLPTDACVVKIIVALEDQNYEATFAIPNEYTIEGQE